MTIRNLEYEAHLTAAMLRSGEAVARVLPLYRETVDLPRGDHWMTGGENRWIVHQVVQFVLKHSPDGSPPSRSYLLNQLRRQVETKWPDRETDPEERREDNAVEREAVLERYELLIDRLRETEVAAGECLLWAEELAKLARHRRLMDVVGEAGELTHAGRFEDAMDYLVEEVARLALQERPTTVELSNLFEEIDEEIAAIQDRRDHPERYRGTMTGVHKLDQEMGGMMPGEVGMIVGSSGRGKTSLIRDVGIQAAYDGARVLIVSAEQRKTLARRQLLARLAGVTYTDLKFGRVTDEQIQNAIKLPMGIVRDQMKGEIEILDVPENCSVGRVRSEIAARLRKRYDVYLWDHLGCMDPTAKVQGDRYDWKVQAQIAEEVRVFSRTETNPQGTRGVVCWCAVQGKPETERKKDPDVTDIGLSYLLGWGAHCAINIKRSAEDERNNLATLQITKVRDGRGRFSVRVRTDLARCCFLAEQYDDDLEQFASDGPGGGIF